MDDDDDIVGMVDDSFNGITIIFTQGEHMIIDLFGALQ